MRLEDLKDFVAVASRSGLRQAALELGRQPGTLSKALRRVEQHYQCALFDRQPGQWQLTDAGRQLLARSEELLALHQTIERELGQPRRLHLRLSGPETLLGHHLAELLTPLQAAYGEMSLQTHNDTGLTKLLRHQVDLALVCTTGEPPPVAGLKVRKLRDSEFVIVAGPGHPLLSEGRHHPIERVLDHPFVVPSQPLYGDTGSRLSSDGWHDEAFARRIGARVDSLPALMALVRTGSWLAYLPDYLASAPQLTQLTTEGCPYHCRQSTWLCTQTPLRKHHLAALME
ncbi:LysR family transcriptional regulator [Ferrimonas balearica]|uniref:LysR family transcriptional regulator n=1 Tax=Ferrimonas balearica TaxID=44012 RepID=UPI001C998902|nr:LysR family transcriptional regulator [Ferrimonas balearica]MBY5990908.1 LysR family transcriptional regulator [Ferrimonas balearica]